MLGHSVTRRFQALLGAAGLERIRWHDLRGGCLTVAATVGVAPRVAQTLAGHSSAALTLDVYTGVPPEAVRDAVNRIDEEIRRAGWTGGEGS
jgi:integrase